MELKRITDIASKLSIPEDALIPYGYYKAKVDVDKLKTTSQLSKLILVTAITPTKAGEGKTTCSISLADGLNLLGEKVSLALREPSLGPVFGIKGGATGGGKVTVEPSEDINLHFNGDMHALTSANNLISAIIDNHIFQGNELNIDPDRILFSRVMDMNDRSLREIEIAHGKGNGVIRRDSFIITVASELMAILCLAKDREDFISRLNKIIVAYTYDDKIIRVKDLRITKALMKLLEDALKPNLVQTAFGTPAFIHGGPFANIAHGCNSIIATKAALNLADYVVTEAGFGSDLGAQKFLDIKCLEGDLNPSLIVMVATIRALKCHGGAVDLSLEDTNALQIGLANLEVHVQNMKNFNKPVVVAINHFASDTKAEIDLLENWCANKGIPFAFTDGYLGGAEGSLELARLVRDTINTYPLTDLKHTYSIDDTPEEKIWKIATKIYRAKNIVYSEEAIKSLNEYKKLGVDHFNICIAKTPQSLSDNAKLLNVPHDHTLHVRSIKISAGAGFLVVITGKVLTMPGLPKIPAAVRMEDE